MSRSDEDARLLHELLAGRVSDEEAARILDRLSDVGPEELERLRGVAMAELPEAESDGSEQPDAIQLERRILRRLRAQLLVKQTLSWFVLGLSGLALGLVRPLVYFVSDRRAARRPKAGGPSRQKRDPDHES